MRELLIDADIFLYKATRLSEREINWGGDSWTLHCDLAEVKTIIDEKQRIDVLVNNAGWGIWGTGEDVSLEEFREQFETNFFSIVRLIQKVAPTMRKQGSGDIVNISSVAGRIGFPVSTAYISSKFALEGFQNL